MFEMKSDSITTSNKGQAHGVSHLKGIKIPMSHLAVTADLMEETSLRAVIY